MDVSGRADTTPSTDEQESMQDHVLASRYYQPGECRWEDVASRVAKALSHSAEEEEEFYTAVASKRFIPNSPTLMNAGTPLGQMSACFVIPVNDSIEGIFSALKWCALIHKTGGGTGMSFSQIRPAGSMVGSTHGVASGVVSFMKIFDTATEQIKQGGKRRGANLGCLGARHPEILPFIHAKETEGVLANFNISVMADDAFMESALQEPTHPLPSGAPSDARVFSDIIAGMWKNGEPGMLFYDTLNRANPTPKIGDITATNPCVSGDTLLFTREYGNIPIKDVEGQSVHVWNGKIWCKTVPRITGTDQPMYKITFSNGTHIRCTPYHGFYVNSKRFSRESVPIRKEAKDLLIGDKITKFSLPVIYTGKSIDASLAYTHGFFSGDGCHEMQRNRPHICLYGEKASCLEFLTYKSYRQSTDRLEAFLPDGIIWNKTMVPSSIEWDVKSRLDWLAGLIDSDGTDNGWGSVCISSVDKQFLENVRYMLTTLGVISTVSVMKHGDVKEMPDGKGGIGNYYCRESYRLTINGSSMIFLKEIGLTTYRVDIEHNVTRDASRFITVTCIEKDGIADTVYCVTVPDHSAVFNGILTANCGEEPLLNFESCTLGSINLSLFYDPATDQPDYAAIAATAKMATRFLDTVISRNTFVIPEIRDATLQTRKIGIGIMGLADLFIKMKLAYNSREARDVAQQIMSTITTSSMDASMEMARTGYNNITTFPAWDRSVFGDPTQDPASVHPLFSPYVGKPLHNAATTCIAPTGTISIFAGVSSGAEPVFSFVHERRNAAGRSFFVVHPLFSEGVRDACAGFPDASDRYDAVISHCYTHGTIQDIPWLTNAFKRTFVSALDISPRHHILMQATLQGSVHAGVSKTINLPPQATESDIRDAVLLAWKSGCKGITLYRQGSRDGEVLSLRRDTPSATRTSSPPIPPTHQPPPPPRDSLPAGGESPHITESGEVRILPKRPDTIPGVIVKKRSGCGKLIIPIGELHSRPYEVPASFAIKGGGCHAMLMGIDGLLGLCLRWGVPIWDITETLIPIRCDIAREKYKRGESDGISCPSIIGHAIKNNCPDDIRDVAYPFKREKAAIEILERVKGQQATPLPPLRETSRRPSPVTCPDCAKRNVVSYLTMEEGCRKCYTCGFSRC